MLDRLERATAPPLTSDAAMAQRRDWILAALIAVGSLAEAAIRYRPAEFGTKAVLVAVICGLLPHRRRLPLAITIVGFTAVFIHVVIARALGLNADPPLVLVIAGIAIFYALFRWGTGRQVIIGLATSLAIDITTEFAYPDIETLTEALLLTAQWVPIGLFALAMRYRAALAASRLAEARLHERNAIARDLHDTVAHQVSAIAIQAQAAKFAGQNDPAAVLAVVDDIERTANEAMDEMRRMVGILRSDHDITRTATPPDLTDLAQPDSRPPVTVAGETNLGALPTSIANAVYRVAQESATNALRHNDHATFVHVDLSVSDTEIDLRVTNDGQPTTRRSGGGWGTIGMRERVEALAAS